MPQAKAARWLDLIAYLLQHRFPVTREGIFEHVADYRASLVESEAAAESVRRKFERDKDELRALGIEIETVQPSLGQGDESAVGYQLKERSFYLPYLEFGVADARGQRPYKGLAHIAVSRADAALLDRATHRLAERTDFPLAAAAASARRKLEFDLPLPLSAIERVLARPLTGDAARCLEVLQQAVAEHVAVRCLYFSIGRDAEERRVIEPYGLFFNWGRWYAAARARDRDAMRVFRLDRMREAELVAGKDAHFSVPPGFSVRQYVHRSPWELTDREPVPVRVRFAFPESRWVLARELGKPIDALTDDGGAVLEFAVRDRNPFLRWLLTFRDQAAVVSPPAVADELKALRSRVAQRYAGTPR